MAHRGVGIVSKSKMDNLKSPIVRGRLKDAAKAVLENLKICEGDSQIFDPVHEIYLTVTMHKRIPHPLVSTFKIRHPIYNSSTEICVFTKDISVKDPEKTIEFYERRFKKLKLSLKFIPFASLKKDYTTAESRKFLARSYGMYIVEACLSKFISRYLGPEFYSSPAAKRLQIMNFESDSIFTLFNTALKSTIWKRTGIERTSKIYVAPSTFSIDEIADNLNNCIKGVALSAMRGWENVRYLHVKSKKTLCYPIYVNEDVSDELEILDPREAIRQFTVTKNRMKGDTLYTMSDQEIHGMLLQRLEKLKPVAKPPKKRRKLDLEALEEEASEEEEVETEEEIDSQYEDVSDEH